MPEFVLEGLEWKKARMEKIHEMVIILKKHFCMEIIIVISVITTFGLRGLSMLI